MNNYNNGSNFNGFNFNNNDNWQNNRNNEFMYQPNNKKNNNKVLIGVIAAISVVIVSATSIAGYSLINGNGKNQAKNSAKTETSSKTEVINREVPSLEQLAAPEDAMKIPDIVKKVSPSVVGISTLLQNGTATGTGIVLSEDGYIITNAHVIEGATAVNVVLPTSYEDSDEDYKAEIIGKDTETDIAVLKIEKSNLVKADFGKSSEIQVGELSIAIGNPLGLELANSVTQGIISAVDRTITMTDKETSTEKTLNCIQTDASINNGNSGGPLINAYGQVIGITSAKVTSTYGEGLGFAIPIDDAMPIIEDLIRHGYVTGRPSIGILGENISDVYANYYGIHKGVCVKNVNTGSAAEKAGIKVNDIIVGIEDVEITTIGELNNVKKKYKAGDTVVISAYRNGSLESFDVTLDEAEREEESSSKNNYSNNDLDDYYRSYRDFFDPYY